MATMSFFGGYNMSTTYEWDWVVTSSTGSEVVIEGGGNKQEFRGAFSYDNHGNVFGTCTSSNYYVNGALIYTASGMSADASVLANYCLTSGNQQETLGYVLSGSDKITGSTSNDILLGYGDSDFIYGQDGNDTVYGKQGDDTLDGGTGSDTAIFSGTRASHTITKTSSGWTVSSAADGTDTLSSVERLKFSDGTLAIDNGNWQTAGEAYRLYQAAFARTPDTGGLKYWVDQMDSGQTVEQVAYNFIASAEFQSMYGKNPTHVQEVTAFYQHVLGRAPDQGGLDYWTGLLDNGKIVPAQVLINFSESAENVALVGTAIQNGIWLGS